MEFLIRNAIPQKTRPKTQVCHVTTGPGTMLCRGTLSTEMGTKIVHSKDKPFAIKLNVHGQLSAILKTAILNVVYGNP